jgi:hypothetical protein
VQRAGDLIYVPSEWHHHILNLWPSIAVNHEFMTPAQDGAGAESGQRPEFVVLDDEAPPPKTLIPIST